jgi:hypothetical protein
MSTSMHRFPSLAGQEEQQEPRVMRVGTAADGEGQGQASLWRLQTQVMTSDDFLTRAVQRGSHAVFMATATTLQQEDYHHHHTSPSSVPILWVIYLNADYYTSVFAHGVEYFSTLNVSSSCYYGLEIFRDRDNNNNNNVLSFRSSDDNTNNNNGSADNTRVDDDGARRVNDDRDAENSAVDDTALLEGHDELTRRRRRLSNNNNAMIHDVDNNNSRTASSPTEISSLQTVVLNLETAQTFSSRNLRIHTVNSQGQVSNDFDPFEFDDQRWDSKDDDNDDDDGDRDGHVTDSRDDDGAPDNRNNRNHHSLETIQEHADNATLLVDDRSRVNDAFWFDI